MGMEVGGWGDGGSLAAVGGGDWGEIHSDKPCGKGENRWDRHTESRVWTRDSDPSALLRSPSRRTNGPDSQRAATGRLPSSASRRRASAAI